MLLVVSLFATDPPELKTPAIALPVPSPGRINGSEQAPLPRAEGSEPTPVPHSEDAEDIIARAEKAVVFIRASHSEGSGFFVEQDGLILTNHHVVGQENSVVVTTHLGQQIRARVQQNDTANDIAVLKIEKVDMQGVAGLSLGTSRALRKGTEVIAIGFPLGSQLDPSHQEPSATRGSVTARRDDRNPSLLQTDAGVYPGNSGGPLLNARTGKVVGIITSKSREADRIVFALPIEIAKPLLQAQDAPAMPEQP